MSLSLLTHIASATILPAITSIFLALTAVSWLQTKGINNLISFTTGMLLSMALLHLLPESAESLSKQGEPIQTVFSLLLAGLIGFFLLQKFALFRHDHHNEHDGHKHHHGFDKEAAGNSGWLILLGSGIHNFTDGLLIAAAFLVSSQLGWATAMSVGLHEIMHKLGDFVVLLNAGIRRKKALVYNLITGLNSFVGGIIGYFVLSDLQSWIPYVLVISASSFIYVAVADLIPQMNFYKSMRQGISQIALLLLGVAVIWLMQLSE